MELIRELLTINVFVTFENDPQSYGLKSADGDF